VLKYEVTISAPAVRFEIIIVAIATKKRTATELKEMDKKS
jgi:hypothetical protein